MKGSYLEVAYKKSLHRQNSLVLLFASVYGIARSTSSRKSFGSRAPCFSSEKTSCFSKGMQLEKTRWFRWVGRPLPRG